MQCHFLSPRPMRKNNEVTLSDILPPKSEKEVPSTTKANNDLNITMASEISANNDMPQNEKTSNVIKSPADSPVYSTSHENSKPETLHDVLMTKVEKVPLLYFYVKMTRQKITPHLKAEL